MQTEIQFLIDLLLNHKCSAEVKKLLIARVGEVEATLATKPQNYAAPRPVVQHGAVQCASTQALLDKEPLPVPPSQIAQTPEAAAALARRNETLMIAMSDKPEKGRTSPRKW